MVKIMKIYIASKTKHAQKWIKLLRRGHNIISTWILEAGEGESTDLTGLSIRCIVEATEADVLILYCENGELLKGALLEAGAALGAGKEVRQVGDCQSISKVLANHPNWHLYDSLVEALHQ
jgi:hypothetical protein